MPPLHGDPNSDSTPLPILNDAIMGNIRDPLQRLHKQELPPWYQDIEEAIVKLVQLGTKISRHSEAVEARRKLKAIADATPPLDSVRSVINTQLIRNTRDCVGLRLDCGHLSLFLASVDGWLRSCEEFILKQPSIRTSSNISAFEDAYQELIAAAAPHTASESYVPDDLLGLFDNLGLIKGHGS
ncbi:hypothetical protein VFPPC_14598 [Pochonia chlamydosporia 170]|uniref:Uncharacterized protein n=1 Tax=Pochonia chlamydosporia 170 TaxID=1380566 RepID=A0A179F850_METCM|nr:hypothetical protein VFPPC_14598 [Pochonia chlamydosporia 170]OAQ61598.1 hypothetical protein VFPPC_14598 [Pochonia chlamydosporia 170]